MKKKVILLNKIKIYKTIYLLITIVIMLLPSYFALGFNSFYKSSERAIDKLGIINTTYTLEIRGYGEPKKHNAAIGYSNEKDFINLSKVIKKKIGLRYDSFENIALVEGDLNVGTMISPNSIILLTYDDGNEEVAEPIIFHPFDGSLTKSRAELYDWLEEYNLRKMNLILLFLIPLWTALNLLIVFREKKTKRRKKVSKLIKK